jgi:hypothetical protein
MTGIKFIQDIDVAGRGQYDADLLDILNGQAIVRGDLTPQRSKAIIVTDDPSTRTISRMGAMWQSDVTWHSSGHQHQLFLARVPLRYRVQLPWGTCQALGRNVTTIALCYKRLQQALERSRPLETTERKSQCLNNTTPILPWT